MLNSPTLIVGMLGFVVAVGWFAFGGWLSGAKPAHPASMSKLPPLPPLPAGIESQPAMGVPVAVPSAVRPVRIQGGMTTIRGGEAVWLWVSEEGHLMTEEEIAAESGGTVSSRMVRGVRVLSGTGVLYGGMRSEQANSQGSLGSSSVEMPAHFSSVSPAPDEPPAVPVPGKHDLLATPPGLLASPPGLLATPPDLR